MAAMTVSAIIIFVAPTFWPMALALSVLAVAGDAFVPAVSALTLGLVTRDKLARRLGRNSAFDHGGNIAIALLAGAVGYAFSQRAVFLMVPMFAALTSAAVLAIPANAINHDRARDLTTDGEAQGAAAGYRVLFQTRPLMIFALCAFLFHFANAPLLPLVGQKLAVEFPQEATAMMSFCMVAAQGVMLPIAILVGRNADAWGRRPLFLVAFAVLPIRAALYPLSDNAFWLIGVQLLDGVGAGIYQALTPLMISDMMRGTGRFNLAQGAVATTHGRRRLDSADWRPASLSTISAIASRFLRLAPLRPSRFSSSLASCPKPATNTQSAEKPVRRRSRERRSANESRKHRRARRPVLTYLGVAVGRIPGLRLDRAGIAFLGGAAMIAVGPLSLEEAFRAIDFDTIALLLGMMIVVAHLKVSGAFRALGGFAIDHAHAPFVLLVTVTMMAGVLSAFLVNDAICLVMTPIVLQVVRSLGRNPLPYLVAVATASNCGSVATITGNPQNMVIGTLSRIPYPAFAAALAPVATFGLVAVILMVRLVYAKEFAFKGELEPHSFRGHMHGGQVLKASVTCIALAIAFFAGVAPAKAAILAGAFLLLTRQIKPHRIYRELDGPLLILFAGMFVVVAGAEKALLTPDRIAMAKTLGLDMVWRLSLFTAVLSNIVSNVPAVLALRPFIPTFPDPQRAWLVVAMSSTLAGNFTLLGSVANLIVAERARAEGMPISFWAYFKVGAPLTIITLAAGTAWLMWR